MWVLKQIQSETLPEAKTTKLSYLQAHYEKAGLFKKNPIMLVKIEESRKKRKTKYEMD